MKRILVSLSLLTVAAAGVMAQTTAAPTTTQVTVATPGAPALSTDPVTTLKKDNERIRRDNANVGFQKKEIGQDKNAIVRDELALDADKARLAKERAERNRVQRKEDALVRAGDTVDAQKLEARREIDNQQIGRIKANEAHVKADELKNEAGLKQERKELHDARAKRDHDVKMRNHDAAKI